VTLFGFATEAQRREKRKKLPMYRPNLLVSNLVSLLPFRRGFPVVLLVIALAWFALPPAALAVDPPPDGGYAGANTAEGDDALPDLTGGANNTAIGFQALFSNTSGNFNTATGVSALRVNETGKNNTANGGNALFNNTGSSNIAVGASAGVNLTPGSNNIDIAAPGCPGRIGRDPHRQVIDCDRNIHRWHLGEDGGQRSWRHR
jgi:hypothetical protein